MPVSPRTARAPGVRETAICAAVLIALAAVTFAPQVRHGGFYSDDWGLLSRFSTGATQSFLALVSDNFPARPVQGIYSLLLFRAFGLDPLGSHMVNAAVLAVSAALLCLLFVRLGVGRAQSFA